MDSQTAAETDLKLARPPIVEAVLDIDCDLPPNRLLASLEVPAREMYRDRYPRFRAHFRQEHQIEATLDTPVNLSVQRGVIGLRFLQDDEKQLVQVRAQGFSFNRLAPYTSLDDYLPEIRTRWQQFVELAAPVLIRSVGLRYINRILVPIEDGNVELDAYFKVSPRLPDGQRLSLVGFVHQHAAVERLTGHQVNIVMASQPFEADKLPVILDNAVATFEKGEPGDWEWILAKIQCLRALKNEVFRRSLTESCLKLFQQP
jgi:uncharacterized protein (TIGR04255 family)